MTESDTTSVIELIRRDGRTLNCTFWYYDDSDVRQALDITGMTLKFTVKRRKSDSDDEALIGPKAGTIISGPLGTATVALSGGEGGDTDLDEGVYYYDLQLSQSGIPQSTKADTLIVHQDITGVST